MRYKKEGNGLRFERYFSREGRDPFETSLSGSKLEYELRKAEVNDDKGNVIFVQDNVLVPKNWSQRATNILAEKYFYGRKGSEERENSVKQVYGRVVDMIAERGMRMGYFNSEMDAKIFADELKVLMVNQAGMFNSPVIFNFGLYDKYDVKSGSIGNYYFDLNKKRVVPVPEGLAYKYPQGSACFIIKIEDNMHSIMKNGAYDYAMLFKYGSGAGSDLSNIRSSREMLTGGGKPSGPLSFMKIFDSVAAVVKSGGKTRRAAIMQSLKVSHPDIMEFITAKQKEEKKAWALIEQGYDGKFGGEAYNSVAFQNMNLSVRVSDEFMKILKDGKEWQTVPVFNKNLLDKMPKYPARDIFRAIAEGTYICGDPGIQYDDTINRWNTCLKSGRINASNPCSEFMFLDNSACNLASLNIQKFMEEDGTFNVEKFKRAIRNFIVAQEIIVDAGSYPSKEIAENSHNFRPLGLGYANIGSAITSQGLPYDSDTARAFTAAVTSLMTSTAYKVSTEIAKVKGTFPRYEENKESTLEVILKHKEKNKEIEPIILGKNKKIIEDSENSWEDVVRNGEKYGFRNAQVTLLAPTGTIGFVMDCETTGIEPDVALVKYKKMVGGGLMKMVSEDTIRKALTSLGYEKDKIEKIVKYVEEKETIEGAPELKEEHIPIFDCAFKPKNGGRFIPYQAHLKMMAAAQPFLSGAISKTINLPNEATIEEIMKAYEMGYDLGLKAVAIYRDGSKRTQPLSSGKDRIEIESKSNLEKKVDESSSPLKPKRVKLPKTRFSLTHKFDIAGHEGYMTVGLYPNGKIGEVFITMAKEGSFVSGVMDQWATSLSIGLQYGIPLSDYTKKMIGSKFEPSGFVNKTNNEGEIDKIVKEKEIAHSIMDYLGDWLNKLEEAVEKKEILLPIKNGIQSAVTENQKTMLEDKNKILIDNKEKENKTSEDYSEGLICKICGAPAKRTNSKCGIICINNHIDDSGCAG